MEDDRLQYHGDAEETLPVERFSLAATLLPGQSSAAALLRRFNRTTDYLQDGTTPLDLYDVDNCNFGLPGEVFRAQYYPDAGRYEIVGSKGLRRKAVADEDITIDDSGSATIWTGGAATSPAVQVTAHLNWMHNDEDVSLGKELIIEWFPDEGDTDANTGKPVGQWVIVAAECEASSGS